MGEDNYHPDVPLLQVWSRFIGKKGKISNKIIRKHQNLGILGLSKFPKNCKRDRMA